MKTKNSILGIMIVALAGTLGSCSATLDAQYGRPAYAQRNEPVRIIDDPDLPPAPSLAPRQIDRIKAIRRDERMKVDYLEQRRREILSQRDRSNRSERPRDDNARDRKHLENELRKVESRINQEHRRADDRVYSVLTNEQRRYWRR